MTLPTLPQELWTRIAIYLPPAALSSLSKVNKSLHDICTSPEFFHRHLTNLKPIEPRHSLNPAQRYRRLRALSYPPGLHFSLRISREPRLVCTVDDTLVLHDVTAARLVAFPSGVTVEVVRLVGDPPVTHHGLLSRSVTLPGNRLGFVSAINRPRLKIWDIVTGEVSTTKLKGGLRTFCATLRDARFAVLAGNSAEWIMYHADDSTIAVVNWHTGDLVREITDTPFPRFVLGECDSIDGMSIIGVSKEETDGFIKEIQVKSFDGEETTFRVTNEVCVGTVQRSKDRKTHFFTTSRTHREASFTAYRKDGVALKIWDSELCMATAPVLIDNGRVIKANCNGSDCHYHQSYHERPRLYITLCEDGTTQTVTMKSQSGWSPPIWFTQTAECTFAVMVTPVPGIVEFIRIEQGIETCLKKWQTRDPILDAEVVGDHFVVVACKSGWLHIWHFDRFCGAKGVLACPGLVPEGFDARSEGLSC